MPKVKAICILCDYIKHHIKLSTTKYWGKCLQSRVEFFLALQSPKQIRQQPAQGSLTLFLKNSDQLFNAKV